MGSSYEFWIVRKIPHLIVLLYAADKLVADTLSIIEIMELCSCDQTNHSVFFKKDVKKLDRR